MKNLLQLRHLEVFYAIIRTGSITEAARLLHVSQPAITASLKHAESRIGLKLFERSGGRLRPTPEGEAMLPDVVQLFDRVNIIDRLVRDLAGGTLGSLSIAAAFPVSNGYVAEAVSSFLTTRPDLKVALHAMTSNDVLDRVLSREVDIGIAHEPIVSDAVDREPISQVTIACIVNRQHPLADRKEVSIEELAGHRLITYLPHAVLRPYIDHALTQAGLDQKVQIQVNISSTALQLARFGAGVALVESFLLESTSSRNDLVVVPLKTRIVLDTVVITSRAIPRSETTTAFIAHLRKTAAGS